MTITLYAQPYELATSGFYFDDANTFEKKSRALRNDYGEIVEEFEIQFIDGESLDAELFKALGVHQGSVCQFLEAAPEWEEINIIIACGECGYTFDIETDDPDHFGISIYNVDSLNELAIDFINDGVFGEIPMHLENYIDIEAIAADLRHDYTQTTIAGMPIVYRAD